MEDQQTKKNKAGKLTFPNIRNHWKPNWLKQLTGINGDPWNRTESSETYLLTKETWLSPKLALNGSGIHLKKDLKPYLKSMCKN